MMTPISTTELASLQADAAALLDLPCVIQRSSPSKDAYASTTDVWNAISPVGFKAGMSLPTGGQLQNYAYLIGSLASWQVKLPVGTDVRAQDRLIIAGQSLTVQIALSPRSYPALLTVLASEIAPQETP